MPKTYLSFLGTNAYEPTAYFVPTKEESTHETPYVQEAILQLCFEEWEAEDRIYVFTTEMASNLNYYGRKKSWNQEPIAGEGLEGVLAELKRQSRIVHYEEVDIPNGNSEEEVWEVFRRVYERIRQGDELYLDITYAFRFLPMLGMTLLNYAKALKEVAVKAIFYGNFEAGKANKKTEQDLVKAPIQDFLAFSQLQDWTYAGQSFLQSGNASVLASLLHGPQAHLSDQLMDFSQSILTNRAGRLTWDFDMSALKNDIALEFHNDLQAQLEPILDRIQEKISPFQDRRVENGLLAARWCLDHSLIPQGVTFLQETVLSVVISKVLGMDKINESHLRRWCGGLLVGKSKEDIFPTPKADQQYMLDGLDAFLSEHPRIKTAYQPLVGKDGLRNDLNHGGFGGSYRRPEDLNREFEEILGEVYETLRAYRIVESLW